MSLHDDLFDILEISTKESATEKTLFQPNSPQPSKSTIDDFLEELLDIPISTHTTHKQSSTQEEEAMWGEFDDNAFEVLSDTPPQIGFKTAGGKDLKPISEEAIKRACRLLNESEKPQMSTGFKTASGKQLEQISEDTLLKACNFLNEPAEKLPGFTSASGKQLKPISPAALEKAKALFVDIPDPSRLNTMFTTASGKVLTASKKETERWTTALIDDTQEKGIKRRSPDKKPPLQQLQDISNKRLKPLNNIKKKNKPFKSPISNLELTKAAIGNQKVTK